MITFTDFYTEPLFDIVDVFDFIDNEYRLLKRPLGVVSQTSLISTGNKIKFTPGIIDNRRGFKFSVQFGMYLVYCDI